MTDNKKLFLYQVFINDEVEEAVIFSNKKTAYTKALEKFDELIHGDTETPYEVWQEAVKQHMNATSVLRPDDVNLQRLYATYDRGGYEQLLMIANYCNDITVEVTAVAFVNE